GTAPLIIQDTTTGIDIPAGEQAVIYVTVALENTTTNYSGLSFTNSAWYTYNKLNGGGSSTQGIGGADSSSMNVVEPHLTATKTVSYASPAGKSISDPAAVGDILQYVVTVTNDGNATAYDADIIDTLPPNAELVSGSASAQINGSPDTGFLATPSPQPSGAVAWGNLNGDPSLDIPVNGSLVLTYQVRVLSVDGAPVSNTIYAAWTSLDGQETDERTGDGCPDIVSPNTYCSGPVTAPPVLTLDPTTLAKSVVSDTWNSGLSTGKDATVRIGDTVVYSLALTLREGETQNVVVTDTLPTGLAFDSLVNITPASGSSNFTYTVASQPTPGSTGTLTWNLGNISNAVDNNSANNTLVIQYRAKVVKNTLVQTPTTQVLTNNAALSYAINGTAAASKTSSATINVWQPLLSVSKSAAPADGGTVISPDELITYTVDISNSGASPAYNTILTDILPVGLRQAGVTTTSITLVNAGTALPLLASPYFSYNSATGVASWNFDTGVANIYTIPPGETLQVVYQVRADSTLGTGMTLVNNALVQHYYSFDSQDVPANSTLTDRQVYGPTSAATVQITPAAATALSKQALVSTVAIGQPFTYEITIPAAPQPTSMYDVRVLDDLSLATTGVTMSYVSASAHLKSGTQSWTTLTNSGAPTNVVLEDTTSGLDIPASDQLVVDVTVVLNNDTVNNTVGKQFQNTANYTYDSVNNDKTTVANGAPGASGPVTIVGPNLTLQKSGPSTMRIGVPGTFSLNVQNTGTATAWNTTLTDILPNVTSPMAGGMCGSAPTNVTAGIYQDDGTLVAPLSSGTDFTFSFTGVTGTPACTWTIAMKPTATTAIAPTNRLIVTYQASLDPNSASGLALTNVAGATEYLSADPAVTGASGNVQYTPTRIR
ncbi:MAG: isopeptide-forming domain-containing fimbrial protein, partial [Gammaproteobacteria bacterium]